MQTRSAWLKAPWLTELRTIELADPPPADWVRLRVEACGVCGTDVTAARQYRDWKPFGHEIAGVVEAVAPDVKNVRPGDRVALESGSACGRCELCRNARGDLCRKAPGFWGQPAMGFSERMLVPAVCCVPYTGLTPAVACLTEPAGVAYDLVRVAGVTLGDRVCVVGPGPIGLMAIAIARAAGAREIVCLGRAASRCRLELAAALGARVVPFASVLPDAPELRRAFDHVLMTAPVACLPPALAYLDYEGKLTYVGIGEGDARVTFDANDFHFRKLQLRASFAAPAAFFPRVLGLIQSGQLPAARIISHRFALDEIGAALATLRDRKDEVVKVVVLP